MQTSNVLFILSDEHSKRVLGCYGNDLIKTPHLDGLAARGTRFDNAYTPCPICVPARSALQAGRYVFQTGHWSNGEPYCGKPRGWAHSLRAGGHAVTSVGKLHFRATTDDNGFGEEIAPMHVVDGVGDLHGLIRRPPPKRPGVRLLAEQVGLGESSYGRYDEAIFQHSSDWLRARAQAPGEKPWVLFVSLVRPHFPMIAPRRLAGLYPPESLPLPFAQDFKPAHPVLAALREVQDYDDYFADNAHRLRALSSYYGMVSAVDEHVGGLLSVLQETGLDASTRVIYSSDHGDNLGNRGFWGKSTMFEDSAAIPLIIAGPDIPVGRVIEEPASLVDIHQTVLAATGCADDADSGELPGYSLIGLANGDTPERTILSEYHAVGSITGCFMIRHGRWKYIYYPGYRSQLFDLDADPRELTDLGESGEHAGILGDCERKLRALLDPDAVNERAFNDQAAMIERHGGVDAVLAGGQFPHTPAPGEAPIVE